MNKVGQTKTVCFFDSGIGGLNLLNECAKRRKDCNFAYFADNYNMPYGSLTHGEIQSLVDGKFQLMSYLNPAAAVVACNTVTAECIQFLRQKYSFPIIGIQPAVKPAAVNHKNCAVLATPATANSQSLKNLVQEHGGGHTKVIACPDLAAYIENNIFNLDCKEVQRLLPKIKCDSIVLGCTHYIYVGEIISSFYNCPVFDGIEGTANRFETIIGNCDFPSDHSEITFFGGDCMKNSRIFSYLSNNKN